MQQTLLILVLKSTAQTNFVPSSGNNYPSVLFLPLTIFARLLFFVPTLTAIFSNNRQEDVPKTPAANTQGQGKNLLSGVLIRKILTQEQLIIITGR